MKKGFTLVELLAVIVILAIIALIATPIVLNVINQTQEGADLRSVEGYAKALETAYYADVMVGGNGDINSLTPEYSGATVNCEQKIITDSKIILKNCTVDGSTNLYEYNNGKATKVGTETGNPVENGPTIEVAESDKTYKAIVYLDPSNLEATCNASNSVSATGTTIGCMKWYAYAETDSTYDLILDHNTTAKVQYNSDKINTSMKEIKDALTNDTSTWESTLNARLITAGEIATITGNTEFDEDTTTSSGWFYLDSNSHTQTVTTQGASKYSWLFDYTNGCTSYGCNIEDASVVGYWTSTPVAGSSVSVWHVYWDGGFGSEGAITATYGLRPVITISKEI